MARKYFKLRVIILLVVLLSALVAIAPKIDTDGVLIKSIERGSTEEEIGITVGEIILAINGKSVKNILDYNKIIEEDTFVPPNQITVTTTKGSFSYEVLEDIGFKLNNLTIIDAQKFTKDLEGDIISINKKEINGTNFYKISREVLPKKSIKIKTNIREHAYLTSGAPKITVSNIPNTNIKKGLDLEGGTRVLLQPVSDKKITDRGVNDLISILENRLNVYGLTDLRIRSAEDLENNKFVLIEVAGATSEEIKERVEEQGVFEAKIGEEIVFEGGKRDIPFVCRDDGTCSGLRRCGKSSSGYSCQFAFTIHLSPAAAKRHSDITNKLDITQSEFGQSILSKPLDLYLDGQLIDSLQISANLKGKETTQIEISGPGVGSNEQIAQEDATENMKELQTVLITGSLPYDIKIVKLDYISPSLGKDFVKSAFLTVFLALMGVAIFILIRYRTLKIVIPMIMTSFSEIFIILGVAALINWNLDIAAIAGIIATVGTGIDHQIIITDEALKGKKRAYSWKQSIKRAFFIIFIAYATTTAAMIPLWNAGAGLLRGFAVITIIGISIGVFVTRPAYASIIESLLNKE